MLKGAYWIPLGKEPSAVLAELIKRGEIDSNYVLDGFPHPSGANAERIAYFLGRKPANQLSEKTNPHSIDASKAILREKIRRTA